MNLFSKVRRDRTQDGHQADMVGIELVSPDGRNDTGEETPLMEARFVQLHALLPEDLWYRKWFYILRALMVVAVVVIVGLLVAVIKEASGSNFQGQHDTLVPSVAPTTASTVVEAWGRTYPTDTTTFIQSFFDEDEEDGELLLVLPKVDASK